MFLRIATPIVFLLQWVGIWQPSVWEDEVATIGGANRSLASLWELTQHVDLVHGSYYFLVHMWGQVFGYSPFAIRGISALAVTVGFVFVFLSAQKLGTDRYAKTASMIFAILPSVTWAATEARSYALTAMFAAVLTFLFLQGLTSHKWFGYFAVALVSTYLFMYLILLVLAHLLVLLVVNRERLNRTVFVLGSISLVALSLPLTFGTMGQSHQVSWITFSKPYLLLTDALVVPYFAYTVLPATASAIVLGVAFVLRTQRSTVNESVAERHMMVLRNTLISATLAVPVLTLLILSLLLKPVYVPRYVMFGSIAMALLLALAFEWLPNTWMRVLAATVLLACAIPSYLDYRAPDGKLTDWKTAAGIIGEHSKSGDALLFGDNGARATISRTVFAYPQEFSRVSDLTLIERSQKPRLLPRHSLQPSMISRLGSFKRIWLLNDTSVPAQQTEVKRLTRVLLELGFKLKRTSKLHYSSVLLFTKRN